MTTRSLLGVIQRVQTEMRALKSKVPPPPQWATVTAITPLRIRPDNAATDLQGDIENGAGRLRIGERVIMQYGGRKIWVFGSGGSPQDTPGWIDFQPAVGYEMHYDVQPQYMVENGVLYMRGAIKPINGGSFGTAYVAITDPLTALSGAPRLSWHSVSTLAAGGNKIPARAYIHETTLQVMVSAVSSTVHAPPDYVMLNGFNGTRVD